MKKDDLWIEQIEQRTWAWQMDESKIDHVQVRFTADDLKLIDETAARLGTRRTGFMRAAIDYVVRNLEV